MSLSIGVVAEDTFEHSESVEEDLDMGEKSGGWLPDPEVKGNLSSGPPPVDTSLRRPTWGLGLGVTESETSEEVENVSKAGDIGNPAPGLVIFLDLVVKGEYWGKSPLCVEGNVGDFIGVTVFVSVFKSGLDPSSLSAMTVNLVTSEMQCSYLYGYVTWNIRR